MKQAKLVEGIVIPTITVFGIDASRRIDDKATAEHITWLASQGACAVVIGGSSGEFPALSSAETKRLFSDVIPAASERVPVYAATGRYSTWETLELSEIAQDAGAQGIMVVVPYYLLPDRASILEHFRTLRKNTSVPIILYNNPATAGVELSIDDVLQLASEGVIDAVKSSQGPPHIVNAIKEGHRAGGSEHRFLSYYGHDFAPLEALLAGGDGWLSGILNVFPGLAAQLWQAAAVDKDPVKSQAIWRRFIPYVSYVFRPGGPHLVTAYKAALEIQGRKVGLPRLPLQPMPERQRKELEDIVEKILRGESCI